MIEYFVGEVHLELEYSEGRFGADSVASNFKVAFKCADVIVCSVLGLLDDGIHVLAESFYETSLSCGSGCLDGELPKPNKKLSM